MRKIMIALLVMVFVGAVTQDAQAQRRGSKKRPKKEEPVDDNATGSKREGSSRDYNPEDFDRSIWDDVNIEIKPGNLFIGNVTSLSLKSNIGYNFNKTFSAGVGGRIYYLWFSDIGQGSSTRTDYGAFAYARAKITRELYVVGEYSATQVVSSSLTPTINLNYASAGIGYMRPGIDWSSGIEFLIVFDEVARNNLQAPIEYWLNFSHNF